MSPRATSHALRGAPAGEPHEPPPRGDLTDRLQKVERQSRWLSYALIVMAMAMAMAMVYVFLGQELPETFVPRQSTAASDRLRLFDESGNTRVYMRVHSGAPVLQLMDENGRPRLSLGLRYNDAPFITLSDASGRTRASLQIDADDKPVLTLFNENGESSFSAN